MPFLTAPLALIGLVSIPVLAGIYVLRNRYRRRVVSSVMLFAHLSQAREGGTKVQKLQTPLLFLLELLALGLLALAATGPMMTISGMRSPLVVVLDDSFSMQAGKGEDTARARGIDAVADAMGSGRYAARVIVAGDRPRRLGDPITSSSEARALLERWRCGSAAADLDGAIALASELGGADARILVITDREPPTEIGEGRVRWVAVGRKASNVAFVAAARSADADSDVALIELANLSKDATRTTVTLEALSDGGAATAIRDIGVDLAPNGTQTIRQPLGANLGTIRARIGADALNADNAVTLVRPQRRPVDVRIDLMDERARALVERAIDAVPEARRVTGAEADLLITGSAAEVTAPPRTWLFRLLQEPETEAYVGPFVVDRAHPLTEGLALAGVIWSAGAADQMPGRALVTAGNVQLLADAERPGNGREIRLRCVLERSTLQQTPNWPVLMANLLAWRARSLPGLERQNVGVDEPVALTAPPGVEQVTITPRAGEAFTVPVEGGGAVLALDEPGEYRITAGSGAWRLAVNRTAIGESDLSAAASGAWGEWIATTASDRAETSVAWAVALAAVVLLLVHLYLVAGRRVREAALGEGDGGAGAGAGRGAVA